MEPEHFANAAKAAEIILSVAVLRVLPAVLAWVNNQRTQQALAMSLNVAQTAVREAMQVLSVQIDEAKNAKSPGGAVVTGAEVQAAIATGVERAVGVVFNSGALPEILRLFAGTQEQKLATFKQALSWQVESAARDVLKESNVRKGKLN